jgi:surface antigen
MWTYVYAAAALLFSLVHAPNVDAAAYPWPAQDGWVLDGHGYWEGECTSFVAWEVRTDRLPDRRRTDFLGDAWKWRASIVIAPRPGDVAQWDRGYDGADSLGHVAYVISANPDATYTVEEYNWYRFHRFDIRVISPNEPSRYLRF